MVKKPSFRSGSELSGTSSELIYLLDRISKKQIKVRAVLGGLTNEYERAA
jgi:hypothetical protein